FFFSSRRRHTRFSRDWSSDVCSSDLSQDKDKRDAEDLPRAKTPIDPNAGQGPRAESVDSGTAGELLDQRGMQNSAHLGRVSISRSEERRVGKECRSQWWASD